MNPLRRRLLALVSGAALLSAAACSDSTAPRGELTPEEASDLAMQLGLQLAIEAPSVSAPVKSVGPSLNVVPAPFSFSIQLDVACPKGGATRLAVTMNGTIDEATESFTANLSGSHRPQNCGFLVHGKTIRTTGALTVTAHAEVKNGVPFGAQTLMLVGELDWRASDGRRGTCAVNYSATANFTTNVATVNGSFCGSTVQFNGPLTG